MHAENCQCDYCRAYANIPWVELTLRVLCPKCKKFVLHADRVHQGVHWSPAVQCETCGFIGVFEVIAGPIGVTAFPTNSAPTEIVTIPYTVTVLNDDDSIRLGGFL